MSTTKTKTGQDWTDEQAQDQYTWLVNTAGNELVGFAGGATHDPRYSGGAIEQLRRIADTANALADRYEDAPEASVEDPAETPRDQLPEQTQKDLAEQEKAEKQGADAPRTEAAAKPEPVKADSKKG